MKSDRFANQLEQLRRWLTGGATLERYRCSRAIARRSHSDSFSTLWPWALGLGVGVHCTELLKL